MIYLDNAATTIKKPDAVYDAVLDAMKHCGNSGRGMSDASLDASRKIYEARMCLTEFFGGEDADRLVFSNLLIRQIIGKAQDSNLCVSRYRHKTVKWILSALPFFLKL